MITVGQLLFAQYNQKRLIRTMTSSEGNYLFLINFKNIAPYDTAAFFIVEKLLIDETNPNIDTVFKAVGTIAPVKNEKELEKYFSEKAIKEMVFNLGLPSRDALLKRFLTKSPVPDFSLYYNFIETKMALGEVFFDANVKPGETFIYKIVRQDKKGLKTDWSYNIVHSKAGNSSLKYFKPVKSAIIAKDSLVNISWKMPVRNILPAVNITPSAIKESIFKKEIQSIFSPTSLIAKVLLYKNGSWSEAGKILPVLNHTGDTITYQYAKKTISGESVAAFIQIEDEVHNAGPVSDTIYTYAVEQRTVPLIHSISVTEITDGIRLAWKQLPAKQYITGIEILRYNIGNKADHIANLNPADTTYTDYAIVPGPQYRYMVKAIFLPGLKVEQKVAASGVGSYIKFSKPFPPQHLTIRNAGKNVQLNWDENKSPSLFGYFIYRGISPKKLRLIDGPVKLNSYLDTSGFISGGSKYYYGIIAQNLRQDTSLMSELKSIIPNRKIEINFPPEVKFYYANGILHLYWNDMRQGNNLIESFLLQKKKSKEIRFSTIAVSTSTSIEDKLITEGDTVLYRVASLSFRRDTSEFCEPSKFILPIKVIPTVNVFFVRNIDEGVHISWPQADFTDRKSYTVYRRLAADEEFIKISTVDAKTFFIIDKGVKPGLTYVYSLSISTINGQQSVHGKSISIKRY